MPWRWLQTRAPLEATGGGAGGGFLVGSTVDRDVIDVLRPWSTVMQARTTILTGLQQNNVAPTTVTDVVAYWLTGETSNITESEQALGSIPMQPHNAGILVRWINVDDKAVAWIAAPGVRTILAARERGAGDEFIWSGKDQITGRAANVTTAMPDATMIAGDFSQLVYAFFGSGVVLDMTDFNSAADFQAAISALRLLVSVDVYLQHSCVRPCCLPRNLPRRHPEIKYFRGSMAGLYAPLPTLRRHPRG